MWVHNVNSVKVAERPPSVPVGKSCSFGHPLSQWERAVHSVTLCPSGEELFIRSPSVPVGKSCSFGHPLSQWGRAVHSVHRMFSLYPVYLYINHSHFRFDGRL